MTPAQSAMFSDSVHKGFKLALLVQQFSITPAFQQFIKNNAGCPLPRNGYGVSVE